LPLKCGIRPKVGFAPRLRVIGNIVIRGLGLSGMVGWSVTLPALLGLALGMWIDRRFPNSYSWTLMFLILGIVLGCWNAWRWMQQQQDEP